MVCLLSLISPLQLGYKSASCSLPDPWWPAHLAMQGHTHQKPHDHALSPEPVQLWPCEACMAFHDG